MAEILGKRRRRPRVGQMRDRVRISGRTLEEPKHGEVDFREGFDRSAEERWARVNTTTGREVFAGVNVDDVVTHEIIIRYDECVTSESWVVLADETRLDVVAVEDLDERREFMKLMCRDRGDANLEASKA